MSSRTIRPVLLAIAALAMTASLAAGTIEVLVTQPGGEPVRDAVAYAVPPTTLPLAKKTATMDQVKRTFVPHVLPVQAGTWVEFPNSDQIMHQVFSVSPARRFQLPLYVGKPARPIQFPEAGIVAIGCNIHEQMNAYIVVVNTPYFATAEAGRAVLADVAAGEYTVRVWYPSMREEPAAQKVTVSGDGSVSVTFATK